MFPSDSKMLSKKSVSILNPTLILPALFIPYNTLILPALFIPYKEIESAGKIRVRFTIDTDFFWYFFYSEGNLFFFFFLFFTKALWFFIYCFYHLTCVCNNFDGLYALIGCLSSALIGTIIYKFLYVNFDYTDFAVSGKVGTPKTGLPTPVVWLSFCQLTVLSRSSIVVKSKFLWRFCVVMLLFGFFCGWRGFCHRTESDLFLFYLDIIVCFSNTISSWDFILKF